MNPGPVLDGESIVDLLRAAFLLESEIADLQNLPAWRRRDLENIVRASARAMREAAARIEQLESLQRPSIPARARMTS